MMMIQSFLHSFSDPVVSGVGAVIATVGLFLTIDPAIISGWEKIGIIGLLIAALIFVTNLYHKERARADTVITKVTEIKAAIEGQTKIMESQSKLWEEIIIPVIKEALNKKT
jgi:hypothetical protein